MDNAIMIISIAVNVILTAIVLFFIFKLCKIEKKYNDFMSKFEKNDNIEDTLKEYIKMVNNVNEENKIIVSECRNIDKKADMCLQNIGFVKYNAFDDVGSDLSFAVAILDNEENGFIINSIYGRTSSNVYAKFIENGTAKSPLSDEEIEALDKAKDMKKI